MAENVTRRDILRHGRDAAATLLLAGCAAAAAAQDPVRVAIETHAPGQPVAEGFAGVSFETAELVRGGFLVPENRSLAALLCRLGPRGVIRLGGNSSDRPSRPPSAGAIADLAAFLVQTGPEGARWRLIYGLDLGRGTPEQAAGEAAQVAAAVGRDLIAFQIGNEPDLFGRPRQPVRPAGWNLADYLEEWRRFARAVRAAVPGARFAGPDTANRTEWLAPAAALHDPGLVLLTHHYYSEGPASSPASTIERMLASDDRLEKMLRPAEAAAGRSGLPLRLTETNSVYGGGRHGVSDTRAAAVWGIDLMFRLAQGGWTGVNFHGGTRGPYSPFAIQPHQRYAARPIYYALLFFTACRPGRLLRARLDGAPAGFRAHAVAGSDGALRLALINKHPDRPVTAEVAAGPASSARILRLAGDGPAPDRVTLGGAAVDLEGTWQPAPEPLPRRGGAFPVTLPPASAALVRLI